MPWSSLWQGGGGGSVAGAFIAHLDYTHAQMLAGDTPREILAAPGVGLIAMPTQVVVLQNFVAGYVSARGWNVRYSGVVNALITTAAITSLVGVELQNSLGAPAYGALTAEADFVNHALDILWSGTAGGGGNVANTGDVWVRYILLTR